MTKSLIMFLIALSLGFLIYPAPLNGALDFANSKLGFLEIPKIPQNNFKLGLDLVGGTSLIYKADLSGVGGTGRLLGSDSSRAMEGIRDVIERRVNLFGVTEPVVQVQGDDRLVVELAGIQDTNQAIRLIGETPFLEFKEERESEEIIEIQQAQEKGGRLTEDPFFKTTGLNGSNVKGARVDFSGTHGAVAPEVILELNSDGAKLFEEITERNVGKRVAIFLDGQPISIPVVQSVITGGTAVISGNFTIQTAKELATRLNAGALPVSIELISQQTVGASLGRESLHKSLKAGLWGFLGVALFMILYYRLPGMISVYALLVYLVFVLTIYIFLPVTLTLAGIAGFILSLGIAVDANILIFERMKEELKSGKSLRYSADEGFRRAWYSIRDSHVTTLLGALILFLFTTSLVKGFALTLGIGVLASLFTAVWVTRENLRYFLGVKFENKRWLFK